MTEAVRGEGGILRNKDGERFMWKYLPEDRRHEYAATDDEARRWVEASAAGRQTDARRPPELSTRDNVARAIYTEVKEGRGSPHGGVFLDISYLPAEHVRRKLPSMYDQFKELADVDITSGPMEVGPTTHYIMGGIRVDAETGATTRAGLFAAGEVAGRAARREPARRQLALGPARVRRSGPGRRRRPTPRRSTRSRRSIPSRSGRRSTSWRRRSSADPGEDPYRLHEELQATMQSLVGIFRTEADLTRRSAGWPGSTPAGRASGSAAAAAYNPGWDLVFELRNMLDRVRGDRPQRPAAQGEPGRPQPARLSRASTRPGAARTASSGATARR